MGVGTDAGPMKAALSKQIDKDKAAFTGITEWVNRSTRLNNAERPGRIVPPKFGL